MNITLMKLQSINYCSGPKELVTVSSFKSGNPGVEFGSCYPDHYWITKNHGEILNVFDLTRAWKTRFS